MKSTIMSVPLSIHDILDRAGQLFPNSEAVTRLPDKTLVRHRYAHIAQRAHALAHALQALGINRGETVATLCWNHHVHLECYFGVPLAGAVLHALNLRLAPADIAWIAADAKDRMLIVDDVLLPLLEQIATHYCFDRVIVFRFGGAPVPSGFLDYESLIAPFLGEMFVPAPHEETDAIAICYTSGTTGRPKGVVYSHRSTILHALVASLPDICALRGEDTILAIAPMFHVNCWGMPYAALMLGARLVLPGCHLHPDDLLDLIRLENPSFALAVPTLWLSIARTMEQQPGRWSLPRGMRCLAGGSAMPEHAVNFFESHGVVLRPAWGMTETSPVATINYAKPGLLTCDKDNRSRRILAGIPVPLVQIRLIGQDGAQQSWDGESLGEIQVRGPYITGSYLGLGADPERMTEDGWLRTGDIGVIDTHGYLRVADRAKDLIKSGGEWISSAALENVLTTHPAVSEAAVIAIPDPKWLERPLACIVFKPGETATACQLSAWLAQSFAKWQLPDRYEILTALPRTSTGKVWKQKLREQFPR
jgi:fatty-acyl-CoA synthase